MSFLKNIFKSKDKPVQSYADFWEWFSKHEAYFRIIVKTRGNVEEDFFGKLMPKLEELKEGIFCLAGMIDNNTVDLVLTADGAIENIVFVEELVAAAPQIPGWKFTALKPSMDIRQVSIKMAGYEFNKENLSFYPTESAEYPDEINITMVHNALTDDNRDLITNGTFIFLDNCLGELEFSTFIDNLEVIGRHEAEKKLIHIEKLEDYLVWRQKEFIERYEGVLRDTEYGNYSLLEGIMDDGKPLIATMNTDLLYWDSKASHPWIMTVEIPFPETHDSGMPEGETMDLLNEIEESISAELKDFEGYLWVGRQTARNIREIYFACKEFRKPSKVLHQIRNKYADRLEIGCGIYKDKYWQSFNRFQPGIQA